MLYVGIKAFSTMHVVSTPVFHEDLAVPFYILASLADYATWTTYVQPSETLLSKINVAFIVDGCMHTGHVQTVFELLDNGRKKLTSTLPGDVQDKATAILAFVEDMLVMAPNT